MGYMYSADTDLAEECVRNVEQFSSSFADAIDGAVDSLYGIHEDSAISADDYVRFCQNVELPLRAVDRPRDIFGDAVVAAFATAEKTFNSATVQRILARQMARSGVRLMTGFDVLRVREDPAGIRMTGRDQALRARHVFNVTFADINELHQRSGLPGLPLRYDTFLHFVLDLPARYRNAAATVIRGPYASLLPSSFRQGHVLASGRHRTLRTATMHKPSEAIRNRDVGVLYARAVDEAAAYLPVLRRASLRSFTVGTRAAHLDLRTNAYTSKAMVFENFGGLTNYHAVLGGKVSCMFDVAQAIGAIICHPATAAS
jgi:hypothetical protein